MYSCLAKQQSDTIPLWLSLNYCTQFPNTHENYLKNIFKRTQLFDFSIQYLMIELLLCWLALSRRKNAVTRLTLTIQTFKNPTVQQWIWGRSCDLYVWYSAKHAWWFFVPVMWKWNDRPVDTEWYWCHNMCGSGANRLLRIENITAFYNINNPLPSLQSNSPF